MPANSFELLNCDTIDTAPELAEKIAYTHLRVALNDTNLDANTMTFAAKSLHFHNTLDLVLPKDLGIEVMNPFQRPSTLEVVKEFYHRYYDDTRARVGVFGINPGRHGAGLSGISFTDPVALSQSCGIQHELGERAELSSSFVYQAIDAFGGVVPFFSDFYLSAVCPLGFVRDGINYNFYDDPELLATTKDFIIQSLRAQLDFPLRRDVAICLGRGKLLDVFSRLNAEHKFFSHIIALDHPRFIMQYRRKRLHEFISQYTAVFESCRSTNP